MADIQFAGSAVDLANFTKSLLDFVKVPMGIAGGAIVLWAKTGRNELTVWGLGKLWTMLETSPRRRRIYEFVTFLGLGIFVVTSFVAPITMAQAFGAGLGWTSLVTTEKSVDKSSRKAVKRTAKA